MTHYDTHEFVTCRVCGARKRALNYHLSFHNLTKAEYLGQYPDAPIISPASAERKSKSLTRTRAENRGRYHVSDETRLLISERSKEIHSKRRAADPEGYLLKQRAAAAAARAAKGSDYKHSDETRSKMKGPRPAMQGRKFSAETRRKISEARSKIVGWTHAPETIQKMREAWSRRKADKEAYEAYIRLLSDRSRTPENTKRLRTMMADRIKNGGHNGRSKDTVLEQRFARYLGLENIAFKTQHIVQDEIGDFAFDFYIPGMNMLVEVDGEYWHRMSLEQFNRDKLKERLALSAGYRFVRISDQSWTPDIIYASDSDITENNQLLLDVRVNHLPPAKSPTRRRLKSPPRVP